ncbi:MAG: hypothetical protein E6R07_06995 [Nevskiaceae bacterium]|nr:MAG: hypothetical protein E6R07_06995 [Nevskiaceae bacterium]
MNPGPISYAEFGEHFMREVVTAQRLQSEIQALLTASIEGEVHKLPADLLKASYRANLHRVEVTQDRSPAGLSTFRVGLQGTLGLAIKVVSIPLKFSVKLTVAIDMTAYTYAPCLIRLLPSPVPPQGVVIDVDPHGIPEDLLDKLNIIQPAVHEEIVSEVNRRIGSPEIIAATTIDVAALARNASLSLPPTAAAV